MLEKQSGPMMPTLLLRSFLLVVVASMPPLRCHGRVAGTGLIVIQPATTTRALRVPRVGVRAC